MPDLTSFTTLLRIAFALRTASFAPLIPVIQDTTKRRMVLKLLTTASQQRSRAGLNGGVAP